MAAAHSRAAALAVLVQSVLFSSVLGINVANQGSNLSPVTRVVELLQSLSKKIEEDSKTEEALYETFVCWGQSMISQKTASNAAANSRIHMLDTYLADLKAGRIELTTERQDLEKELETVKGDMEVSTEVRTKEHSDFESAEAEMQAAIEALTEAIEVLEAATAGHTEGSLISVHSAVDAEAAEGFEARQKQVQRLHQAVELGKKMLTEGDSRFLSSLLTGEVPTWDWKKLNRKATFKMDYKARSLKIQKVLKELLQTFQQSLQDATKKENGAQSLYDTLMVAKGDQKDAAEEALAKMEKEMGARGMSAETAQEELNDLNAQVTADTKYIAEVQAALATKKDEWKTRQELRTGELAAISKAITILHSDDARDLMKKSFASQGYSFLQTSLSTLATKKMLHNELERIREQSKDPRMAALVALADKSGSHFTEVIEAIDKMLALLSAEEAEDLAKKEECEKNRADDTREASLLSRAMDDTTDEITKLEAKIADLSAEIAEKNKLVEQLTQQLKEATENREQEHKEYLVAKADDQDAAALVASARDVLETFYKENGMVFAQQKKQPFTSTAGEAPPAPPSTWETPYGGKVEENEGIVSILSMIHQDILKDIATADSEEAAAVALFEKTEQEIKDSITNLNAEILSLTGEKGQAETDREDNIADRAGKSGELKVVMARISDTSGYCDYFTINYPVRVSNRQIEIDGLNKAKQILSGAKFTKTDPTRELKPGDALLSVRRIKPVHF